MVYDGRTLDFTFKAYPKLSKAIKAEWKSIFGPLKQENEDEDIVNPVGLPEDLPPPILNTRSTGK